MKWLWLFSSNKYHWEWNAGWIVLKSWHHFPCHIHAANILAWRWYGEIHIFIIFLFILPVKMQPRWNMWCNDGYITVPYLLLASVAIIIISITLMASLRVNMAGTVVPGLYIHSASQQNFPEFKAARGGGGSECCFDICLHICCHNYLSWTIIGMRQWYRWCSIFRCSMYVRYYMYIMIHCADYNNTAIGF